MTKHLIAIRDYNDQIVASLESAKGDALELRDYIIVGAIERMLMDAEKIAVRVASQLRQRSEEVQP